MDFLQLAAERYSVRKFTEERLSETELAPILKAAHLAPTGCNHQPQRLLVLNTEQSLEKLKSCTKCHFNAPTAVLVCYNKEECWRRVYDGKSCGVADACIVTTHMMFQAHAMGLGGCWVMHFDPAAMRREFAIPSHIEPVALLVLGHPAPDAAPMALHHTYRPLEEVVVYDHF